MEGPNIPLTFVGDVSAVEVQTLIMRIRAELRKELPFTPTKIVVEIGQYVKMVRNGIDLEIEAMLNITVVGTEGLDTDKIYIM
jgi:hypothetical protein